MKHNDLAKELLDACAAVDVTGYGAMHGDLLKRAAEALALSIVEASARDARQAKVAEFVRTRFGELNMDRKERAARMLEEAFEIAQAEGMTVAEVARLGNYVYSKPIGEPSQEAAGAGVALLAYCTCIGVSADAVEAAEVERIYSKPSAYFRQRQNLKAAAGVALSVPEAKL